MARIQIRPNPCIGALSALGLMALLACGGSGGSSSTTPAVAGPRLTTPPKPQAGYIGDQVTYRVLAEGSGHSYQWLRNGSAISGATTDSYVLPVQVVDDQARYSVRVTASAGGVTTSPEALLDVLYADPAVVAGHDHTLAITTKGKVYAWGVGGNGQLGLGDTQLRMSPTVVPLPGPAVQVTAGHGHSLALLADGRVFAWGNNLSGQLGDGTNATRSSPAPVPGLTGVTFIASGYDHNVAIKLDHSFWIWGYNAKGQLGLGDKLNRATPQSLPIDATALQDVSLGSLHTLLVLKTGALYGFGDNGFGQLGQPSSPTEYLSIGSPLTGSVVLARAFNLFTVLLMTNGQVYGSGENAYGQLSDGSLVRRYGFVLMDTLGLPSGSTLQDIVPGEEHTLLIGTQGAVASVGYNFFGQLGLGSNTPINYTRSQAIPGLNARSVAAGSMSSYALLPDLSVKAWGYNNNGRLGDGTATDRPAPTTIPGLFLGPIPTGVTPPAPVAPENLLTKALSRF